MPKSIVANTAKAKVDPFNESTMEKNVPQTDEIVLTDGPEQMKDVRSSTVNAEPDPKIKSEMFIPVIDVGVPD